MTTQKHYRVFAEKMNVRAAMDGTGVPIGTTVEGHAALFNVQSPALACLGGACEVILPGAFTNALARPDDVKLLVNHDPNLLLARNLSGTLTLSQDDRGLFFSATLPNTTAGRDIAELMKRGDIDQCSFAFSIEPNGATMRMVDGLPVQFVSDVELSDVSIVVYPAYPETDASLRSHYEELVRGLKSNTEINSNDVVESGLLTPSPETVLKDEVQRENEYRKRKVALLSH